MRAVDSSPGPTPVMQVLALLGSLAIVLVLIVLSRPPAPVEITLETANQLREVAQWDAAGQVVALSWSPHRDRIVLVSSDGVSTYDVNRYREDTLSLNGYPGYISQVAFLDDTFVGLLIDWSGAGRLVSFDSGGVIQNDLEIEPQIPVIVSPDMNLLAFVDQEGRTSVFDVAASVEVSEIRQVESNQYHVPLAFNPGEILLAVAVFDPVCDCQVVSLWDVANSEHRVPLGEFHRSIYGAAFSDDGSLLVVAGGGHTEEHRGGRIQVWDTSSGAMIGAYDGPAFPIQQNVLISPDGSKVIGEAFGEIWMWDIGAEVEQATHTVFSDEHVRYESMALNPTGDVIALGTSQGAVLLVDVLTGATLTELSGHRSRVTTIAFSPDGLLLFSGDAEGHMRIWQTSGTTRPVLRNEAMIFTLDSDLS